MPSTITRTVAIELPDHLEARARERAIRNDDLDRLDAYRLDYVRLDVEFTNPGPAPGEADFLRA